MNKKHLTEAQMQELLMRMKKNYTYDAATGRLTSSRLGRTIRGKKLGRRGYLCVDCCLDKRQVFVLLHHAVWAVCKGCWPTQQIDHINGDKHDNRMGCWPTQQIDHINGDKHDNRIENLREVSGSENSLNMLYQWRPNAVTGLPGVTPNHAGFIIKSHQKYFFLYNPYAAFFHLTLIGRRFK